MLEKTLNADLLREMIGFAALWRRVAVGVHSDGRGEALGMDIGPSEVAFNSFFPLH